jgi:hypothetical protein
MARVQFEDDERPVAPPPAVPASGAMPLLVRGAGFVLMTLGLWVALAVVVEAWSLYRSPAGIERMAQAIERGSHLDQSMARGSGSKTEPDEAIAGTASGPEKSDSVLGFRLSYFVAWVISLLLLMLIGRLAIVAVKTGGELVLYDRQVQRLAREIVREARRAPR